MTEQVLIDNKWILVGKHYWTKEQLLKARDWIYECDWTDIEDFDDVRQLTNEQVVRGIRKHYGISGFIKDSQDWDVYGNWELPAREEVKHKQINWAAYEDYGYRKIGDDVSAVLSTKK